MANGNKPVSLAFIFASLAMSAEALNEVRVPWTVYIGFLNSEDAEHRILKRACKMPYAVTGEKLDKITELLLLTGFDFVAHPNPNGSDHVAMITHLKKWLKGIKQEHPVLSQLCAGTLREDKRLNGY